MGVSVSGTCMCKSRVGICAPLADLWSPALLLTTWQVLEGPQRLLSSEDSLLLPTPVQPAEVEVAGMHYCPAARLLAVVLADGRAALCRMADSGVHPVEQVGEFWAEEGGGRGWPAAMLVPPACPEGRLPPLPCPCFLTRRDSAFFSGRSSCSAGSTSLQRWAGAPGRRRPQAQQRARLLPCLRPSTPPPP